MFTILSTRRVLVPLVAALLAPLSAHAQESQLFTWNGRVDREVRLSIRGAQTSNTFENSIQSRARFQVNSALPSEEGTVRVVRDRGRGDVSVIQQPSQGNGYTAIILISDNEGGADNYRVAAYFTPSNSGRYARGDRGRGRNRDNPVNPSYPNNPNYPNSPNNPNNRDDRNDRNDRGRGRYDAQNQAALHWTGDVDGEVQLIWREGGVSQRLVSGNVVRRANMSVSGNSRSQGSELTVSVREGRGRVDVVQQPSASNRYTGIIRVIDPQGGYGHYDITANLR
jgi:hypothetical protein